MKIWKCQKIFQIHLFILPRQCFFHLCPGPLCLIPPAQSLVVFHLTCDVADVCSEHFCFSYTDRQWTSKGKMVCFDALLGTKLWIRCSFRIWCHNFRINYSYAACRMHVNSRKWNETLFKYLHLVGLQFYAVIKIGAFDDLNRILWLLHVLLSPPCIHSPKNMHFSNWQRFCIYFGIFSHNSAGTHAVFKKFLSSSQSAVFPLESRWFPKEYRRSNTPAISWEIGAMRLSTKLNLARSDAFTPCRKTTKSMIL